MNIPATLPHPLYEGAITGLYGDVLQGWAKDLTNPDLSLVVEICVDGAYVAMVRADQFQPDGEAGEYHGFAIQLRQAWLEGARSIAARVANQPKWLDGSVEMPARKPSIPAAVASQVWHTGGLRISGWAWDAEDPARHVQISVREGEQTLAATSANVKHQALANRESDTHGFNLDLPWALADGKLHTLIVENDLGEPLSGSPLTLCCWPEGLEGLLHELDKENPQPEKLRLLEVMAREHTLRAPKSVGFHHYPQWFEVFQQPEPLASDLQRTVGILLISNGDPGLDHISVLSIQRQRLPALETMSAPASNLLPALEYLLNAGCTAILPVFAGDRLADHALDHLASLLDTTSAWAFADCDHDTPDGQRSAPWLKPVWDLDLFMGADIFTPGAIFSAEIIKHTLQSLAPAGGLSYMTWQHLMAGIALTTERNQASVTHLPKVLYHRHSSAPTCPSAATPDLDRHQAMAWLAQQLAAGATVEPVAGYPALLRTRWPLPEALPLVSLIVPTRDQVGLLKTCIEGLLNDTDYPNLEIIVVDNQSSDPEALKYLASLPERGVKVLAHPYPFNYSTINNRAVEVATGEIVGLVNNDIEVLEPEWLIEMISHLLRPNIGAVGAKLLWPNKMVQHGGVVIGVNQLAAHTGNTLSDNDPGYLGSNLIARRQSAVTAACLMIRKSVYQDIGELDNLNFPVAFNDVDLCMRILENNLDIIWTSFAKLTHAESASRGKDVTNEKKGRALREQSAFMKKWQLFGPIDPYYHPGLSHDYMSGPYGALALQRFNAASRKPRR